MILLKTLQLWGAEGAPNIFSNFFTAAEGAVPPEGERNPAEGGCFASLTRHGSPFIRFDIIEKSITRE